MASPGSRSAASRAVDQAAGEEDSPRRIYEVALKKAIGALTLDVRFTLTAPWTVLFAPSAAGKTTVLRMIAGLDRPASGHVSSRGLPHGADEQEEVLTDTSRSLFLPAHRRRIHMVTQTPALFPHRSVLGNVRFGIAAGPGLQEDLEQALALCRVAHLSRKAPAQLSGGESQRVAVARAIAGFRFRLLLLDEPFTGLDTDLRDAIVADLREALQRHGIPVLQVTHDVGEVFSADAEVLRMEAGEIVAQGPAEVVLARERQALLARLQR